MYDVSSKTAVGLLATAGQMMMTRAYAIGRVLSNASLQYLGIAFSFAYGVLLFEPRAANTAEKKTRPVMLFIAAQPCMRFARGDVNRC